MIVVAAILKKSSKEYFAWEESQTIVVAAVLRK